MLNLAYCISFLFLASHLSAAIAITGSNKKVVEFSGVVSATPEGLIATMKKGGDWITIPWEKINLDELKKKNSKIHKAYQDAAKSKKAVYLKLGEFSGKLLYHEALASVRKNLDAPQAIIVPGPIVSFASQTGMPFKETSFGSNAQKQYADYLSNIYFDKKTAFSTVYNPVARSIKIPTNSGVLLLALGSKSLHGRRAAFYALRKNYHLLKPLEQTLRGLQKKMSEMAINPRNKDARIFELRIAGALEAMDVIKSMSVRDQKTHEDLVRFVEFVEKI